MLVSKEKLQSLIEAASLERIGKWVDSRLERAVGMYADRVPQESLAIGASRFGGSPDLPRNIPWPSKSGEPLSFLGQIRLEDLSGFSCCKVLPRSGLLLFFYDLREQPWGYLASDAASWKVLYVPRSAGALERRKTPKRQPSVPGLQNCALVFEETVSIPCGYSLAGSELQLEDGEWDRYYDFREGLVEGTREMEYDIQLFGYPDLTQGDMELQCELVTHGIDAGYPEAYRTTRARSLEAESRKWRLLLQVDTTDALQVMFGDLGRLYFWIRGEDLAAWHFDRCWVILQSH